jgi:hypothetical protein
MDSNSELIYAPMPNLFAGLLAVQQLPFFFFSVSEKVEISIYKKANWGQNSKPITKSFFIFFFVASIFLLIWHLAHKKGNQAFGGTFQHVTEEEYNYNFRWLI